MLLTTTRKATDSAIPSSSAFCAAARPVVHRVRITEADSDLGRIVSERAALGHRETNVLRQAKVGQLEHPHSLDQDVGRLDVSTSDTYFMQESQSAEHLPSHEGSIAGAESAEIRQVAAVEQFHDDLKAFFDLQGLDEAHNVFLVPVTIPSRQLQGRAASREELFPTS
ncbi:MAG: hypothetical protein M1817_001370 [Caeruleum heppii]|nr:MAG: hypothetical protein M1817_001370 [Caeruleum heppii]